MFVYIKRGPQTSLIERLFSYCFLLVATRNTARDLGPFGKMVSTQYPADDKISAHDAAQISEHHHAAKVGGLAANMSPERRAQVEKKLKRKLDARCSLFVLIYIMNCE